jgi:serine/threonine protein kinase
MSICQECGSEVADQDLFCPYCGISLQPVTVPSGDDAAMESTIVMQAPLPEILSDIIPPADDATPPGTDAEPADEVTDETPSAQPDLGAEGERVPSGAEIDEIAESNDVEAQSAELPADEIAAADELPPPPATIEDADDEPADEVAADSAAPEALVIEEISAEPDAIAETPAAAVEPEVEPEALVIEEISAEPAATDEVSAAMDEPVADEPADVTTIEEEPPQAADAEISEPISELEPAAVASADESPEPESPKYPFSLVESDVVIQTDVESVEQPVPHEPAESVEPENESAERGITLEEADVVMSAPIPMAVEPPKQPDTSSGEIAAGDKGSFTSPNLEGGTDGKRSGLKPLSEGTLLNGRYKIVKKIGGGGMGAVYLAVDQNLGGTQRAVKEMVQSHIEEEQQAKAIEDFKRESMILSTLDHPSIPTIYDYFYDEAESRFYLVMKYISGGDLAGRLRAAPEGRIDERTVTEWAVQVIDVLHYLHSLPTTIVYRDLKPSNVMIDGNTGRIMLIDFGIARSINQTQEKGVTAVGTMGYAPPELFSGQVEPRSDIYSLGSTMFHLLTGADPQNNPLLIFDFQKNPRPRQINPRLSDQIERILMRAVEYNADARFSSALEMKLALQQHLDDLSAGRVSYGITEAPAAISLANQNVFCGFCGQRIVATDLFCAFCGSKQPLAQHGVHSEIYSSRSSATARLVIEGTSQLEMPAYLLDKSENLIGRRDPTSNIFPEVDLSKFDPQTKISRRHARVWRDGTSFLIEDLGSSNGTILLSTVSDTLRLTPHQAHPLANGDRIRVGDTTLHFMIS